MLSEKKLRWREKRKEYRRNRRIARFLKAEAEDRRSKGIKDSTLNEVAWKAGA